MNVTVTGASGNLLIKSDNDIDVLSVQDTKLNPCYLTVVLGENTQIRTLNAPYGGISLYTGKHCKDPMVMRTFERAK